MHRFTSPSGPVTVGEGVECSTRPAWHTVQRYPLALSNPKMVAFKTGFTLAAAFDHRHR